jgi:HTH-type transcriptional regulator / antitoxin HigA
MIAEIEKIEKVWPIVKDIISYPRNDRQYKKLVKILDYLIVEVRDNENHHFYNLMETVGSLIESYERENVNIPDAKGIEILKYLMKENSLNQKDLSDLGSQGVVSELLSGKRELNVRQIKTLSERFHISPSVFF